MAYTTINKSTDYFNTKLYTGNGSTNAQTGVGFQPDFTWLKARSESEYHFLYDAIRGATKGLSSDLTAAEATYSDGLTAFASDGFTLGSSNGINRSGTTYASWNWKAGTGQGSSNTDGTINTTYTSVNTTAGFSISKYTGNATSGATVGHGLGTTPSLIIVKKTSGSDGWVVYHHRNTSAPETEYLRLDTTDATADNLGEWNDTAPSSNVFTIGNSGRTNDNGATYIAYCFAEKTGYSKFGSYTGNGNADGSFIYTGFKPAFVIFKNASSTSFWQMHDSVRDPFNEVQKRLAPNSSDAEGSGSIPIDFLSNGIKLRTTATTWNESGSNFIYMCFGQSLVGSNNVPCTAR